MQNETNAFEDLFSKTTDYLETRTELVKLKAVGKISEMGSSLVSRFVIGLMSAMVIIFLNIGIAIWIGDLLETLYLGFFIVTGFYLLVLLVFYLGRKTFLKKPFKK